MTDLNLLCTTTHQKLVLPKGGTYLTVGQRNPCLGPDIKSQNQHRTTFSALTKRCFNDVIPLLPHHCTVQLRKWKELTNDFSWQCLVCYKVVYIRLATVKP